MSNQELIENEIELINKSKDSLIESHESAKEVLVAFLPVCDTLSSATIQTIIKDVRKALGLLADGETLRIACATAAPGKSKNEQLIDRVARFFVDRNNKKATIAEINNAIGQNGQFVRNLITRHRGRYFEYRGKSKEKGKAKLWRLNAKFWEDLKRTAESPPYATEEG